MSQTTMCKLFSIIITIRVLATKGDSVVSNLPKQKYVNGTPTRI